MWLKSAIAVAIILALAGVAPLLSSSLATSEVGDVLTHKVSRGELSVVVTENGTVESANNKEIKCFVKGGSTVLWVIETGTIVKPGDELVRLDTSLIEENITRQQIAYERAVANQIIAKSEVDVAETNIEEYLNGTYQEERSAIEKSIFDAREQVKKSQLTHASTVRMVSKGIFNSLQLEGQEYAVDSASKDLELKLKQLTTLDNYKRKKTLQGLKSALAAAQARYNAEEASLKLEKDKLERDREQLKNCIIKSEAEGMVIFPSAAEWKETPDIEEGAVVREQQTLLMIPDVTNMQVKVGIHESKVDQLEIGMPAKVQLQGIELDGTVDDIAEVTRPAGWWTGNMVKYDTIIKLAYRPGLKPGMSAVVDVMLAEYDDVLKVPVAAILESDDEFLCWVKTGEKIERRTIELGGSNDEFTVVNSGLSEGEEVVLNPLAYVDDAQREALRPAAPETSIDKTVPRKIAEREKVAEKESDRAASGKKKGASDKKGKKTDSKKSESAGAKIIAAADKDGDGALSKEEVPEKDRENFPQVDTNGDGKLSAGELDAAIKAMSGG